MQLFLLCRYVELSVLLGDGVAARAPELLEVGFSLQVQILFLFLSVVAGLDGELLGEVLEVELVATLVLNGLLLVQVRDLSMVDRVVFVVVLAGTWGALLSRFESGVGDAFALTFVSGPAHACVFGLGKVESWLVMAGTKWLGEELVLFVVALLLVGV